MKKLEEREELIRKKVWLFPTVNPGEVLVNGTKITGFDGRALDVTDPLDHSEAEQFFSAIKSNSKVKIGNSSDALKLMKIIDEIYSFRKGKN